MENLYVRKSQKKFTPLFKSMFHTNLPDGRQVHNEDKGTTVDLQTFRCELCILCARCVKCFAFGD